MVTGHIVLRKAMSKCRKRVKILIPFCCYLHARYHKIFLCCNVIYSYLSLCRLKLRISTPTWCSWIFVFFFLIMCLVYAIKGKILSDRNLCFAVLCSVSVLSRGVEFPLRILLRQIMEENKKWRTSSFNRKWLFKNSFSLAVVYRSDCSFCIHKLGKFPLGENLKLNL